MNNPRSIFKSLAGNTFIFAVGNGATLLISFFMVPIYTHILSTSSFGISDLINTTVSMLLPLISLNIFAAVFRWSLENNSDEELIFSNGLFITAIGLLFSVLVGCVLLAFRVKYVWAIGVNLGGVLLLNHFQNFARGINKVKLYAMSGVVASVLNVLSNILLMIIFKFGLTGYLISLIFSNYLTVLFLFIGGKFWNYWDRHAVSKSEIYKMLAFSMPMIPNSFTWWMTNDASRLIILMFVGPAGNGLYAIANKIPSLLSTVFGLFQNAWQISAVETSKRKDAFEIYSVTFNVTLGGLFFGAAVAVSVIKIFMHYYVSPSFFEAWEFVPILLLTAIFSNVSAFLGTTYLVAKKTKGLFTTTIWGTLINLILSFILIPLLGVHGAGISGALGFLIVSMMRLKQTEKWVKIQIKWGFQLIMILGYVLLSGVVYLDDRLIIVKLFIIIVMGFFLMGYLKRIRNSD